MKLTAQEKTAYRRSVAFKLIRAELLEKVQLRCACCSVKKRKRQLQCHHIDELKYKEPDEKAFLVVLCSECHTYIEQKIKVIKNLKNPVPESLLRFVAPYSIEAQNRLMRKGENSETV